MKVVYIIIVAVFILSFTNDYYLIQPKGWPTKNYDFSNNRLTPAGVKLGRRLFYDKALSADCTIACASCHKQQYAFSDSGLAASKGIGTRTSTRNSMPLFNLVWAKEFMWDGGANNLEVQPLAPLTNPNEMGNTLAEVVRRLNQSTSYRRQFRAVFGGTEITGQHVLLALTQFLGTLVSYRTKFDSVYQDIAAVKFTEEEQRGYALFKSNCNRCHTEPMFTNNQYEALQPPQNNANADSGRMRISGAQADFGKFKVPTLRNLVYTPPYLHNGSCSTLQAAIDAHATFGGRVLATEQQALIAFLKTLTDKKFVEEYH